MRFGGLIAAIVFAAVAAVIVLRMSSHEEAPIQQQVISQPPPVKTVNIYVAAQPIPVGSTVSQEMIGIQPWPENLVLDGFVRADANINIIGMVARSNFQTQQPFLLSQLAKPGDPNFLAGALPKGMRVLTIQTNEIEAVAGFIFPGDHVDVLLTHPIMKWVSPPAMSGAASLTPHQESDTVTETLLSNALVMAVDQRASAANSVDKNGNLIVPRSVSLMVTPADAQRLRLGAQKGTVTLALRSLQDKETVDQPILTTMGDISLYQEQTGGGGDTNEGGVMVVRGTVALQSQSLPSSSSSATPVKAEPAKTTTTTTVTTPAAPTATTVTTTVAPAIAPASPLSPSAGPR